MENDRKHFFEHAGWFVENVPGKGLCLTDRRKTYGDHTLDLMHAPVSVVDSGSVYRKYGPGSHREKITQKAAFSGLKGERLGNGPKSGSISRRWARDSDW